MEQNSTIAALATGKGNAALAIIRISGEKTFEIIKKLVKPENNFKEANSKEIRIYKFVNFRTKKLIDEITAIKYVSPKSYTGEDMVEIICHGGEIVVDEILSTLFEEKISIATKGEFTKRAFLNGKMELLKAESIDQIIRSSSKKQHNIAMNTFQGYGIKKINEWKEIIKKIIVEIEAKIEFPEEDDIKGLSEKWEKNIEDIYESIKKEIINREKIKILEKGLSIPIVGIANAGKSSLFNLILGFERVIVHEDEGTTRDAISEELIIGGEKIKIFDTAGLNETENHIEKIGIKKSLEFISNAQITILVTPANREITTFERNIIEERKGRKILGIISKKDLSNPAQKEAILFKNKIPNISVELNSNSQKEKVIKFLKEHIERDLKENNIENGIICSIRQEQIFKKLEEKTKEIIGKEKQMKEEILSFKLREVLGDIEELVGETSSEDIINSIFDKFCIGK
jgi:tRNA modification GTPase